MKKIIYLITVIFCVISCNSNKETFNIGVLTPLTGKDGADYGQATQRGIEIAREYFFAQLLAVDRL